MLTLLLQNYEIMKLKLRKSEIVFKKPTIELSRKRLKSDTQHQCRRSTVCHLKKRKVCSEVLITYEDH